VITTTTDFKPNPDYPSLWGNQAYAFTSVMFNVGKWRVKAKLEYDPDGWSVIDAQDWESEEQRQEARRRFENETREVFTVSVNVYLQGVKLGFASCGGLDVETGTVDERKEAQEYIDAWMARLVDEAISDAAALLAALCQNSTTH